MKTQWNKWLCGVLGLAMALPVAGFAYAQEAADDKDRPRAERAADDDEDRPSSEAPESRDAREDEDRRDRKDDANENQDRGFGSVRAEDDAPPARTERRNDRAPRSIRSERDRVDVNVQDNAGQGSPSDMPAPIPQHNVQPQPMHHSQGFVSQGNCCCGNGAVMYNQNNGYRSARVNNGSGYRSFSYQGGEDGAVFAPAPVYYNDGYVGRRDYGIQNGANWDRRNEHDSRNFSGSYGSRASLRYGR